MTRNSTFSLLMVLFCLFGSSPVEASKLGLPVSMTPEREERFRDRSDSGSGLIMVPKVLYSRTPNNDVSIAQEHGLVVLRSDNNSVRYVTFLAGDEITVRTGLSASAEDKEAISAELTKMAIEKVEQIEKRFGISISRNGVIPYTGKHGADHHLTTELEVRQPLLGEVLALEYALERSLPESNGKKELQILFSSQILFPDRLAEWELSSKDKPTIIVGSDRDDWALEYVLMHELAHHTQYRMGYRPMASYGWRPGKELGWTVFSNPLTGESGWSVTRQDGQLFKHSSSLGKWVRCNREGQPVDVCGKRVKRNAEAELLTHREMLSSARIRPCTSYMNNPMEVQAEGLAMYRMSGHHRSHLLQKSPELYRLVQDFDQKMIKQEFGEKLIRAANGRVVPRTNEIASELRGLMI